MAREAVEVVRLVLTAVRELPTEPLEAGEWVERLLVNALQSEDAGEDQPGAIGANSLGDEGAVADWARGLIGEAVKDGFAAWFEGDGEWAGYAPEDAAPLAARRLVSTLELLSYAIGFGSLGGRDKERVHRLLRKQTYRSAESGGRYELQFQCGFPEARLYLDELSEIDLEDLLGVCSAIDVGIYARGEAEATEEELARLEEAVRDDVFSEGEDDDISLDIERLHGSGIFVEMRGPG